MSSPLQTPFNYQGFIEKYLTVVTKTNEEVPFVLNPIQANYINAATSKDIILKARQQGFSSLILAVFCADYLLRENSLSVVVADTADNAIDLLARVKRYTAAFEHATRTKVPTKYDTKYEMYNLTMNSRYIIGTSENYQFGRSKTITNLHLSEGAFYKQFMKLLAAAGTAVIPTGRTIVETTANGFNDFKTFWDTSMRGDTGFKPHFFKASDFYSQEFLAGELKRLGERLFRQEYPESAIEAFITSGSTYIEQSALANMYEQMQLYELNHPQVIA